MMQEQCWVKKINEILKAVMVVMYYSLPYILSILVSIQNVLDNLVKIIHIVNPLLLSILFNNLCGEMRITQKALCCILKYDGCLKETWLCNCLSYKLN